MHIFRTHGMCGEEKVPRGCDVQYLSICTGDENNLLMKFLHMDMAKASTMHEFCKSTHIRGKERFTNNF